MNAPHLHLLLNHVPVMGTLFALPLLAAALLARSRDALRLALAFCVLVGLSALPAYFSGEPAEGAVEHLPGTWLAAIEEHEDAALASLIVTVLMGLAALAALWRLRQARLAPRWLPGLVLALALIAAAAMARTAWLGGPIRHAELRGETATGARSPAGEVPEHGED